MSPEARKGLTARPFAHRGLHSPGVPENSLAAFRLAIESGYGIELDVQMSRDGQPMVFHDRTLDRMTGRPGQIGGLLASELSKATLLGTGERIPTLRETMDLVGDSVPLLVEIKTDSLDGDFPAAAEAVASAALGHDGPVYVMSFNPRTAERASQASGDVVTGLVTCAYDPAEWPGVPEELLASLRDFGRHGDFAQFISHDARDLGSGRVAAFAASGDRPVLCWTVRSEEEEALARHHAANITFEGYMPRLGDGSGESPG